MEVERSIFWEWLVTPGLAPTLSMNNMESSYIEDRKGGMDVSEDSSEADEEESKRLEERRKEWRVDDRRCSATSTSSSSSSSGKAALLQVVTLFFAFLFFNEWNTAGVLFFLDFFTK